MFMKPVAFNWSEIPGGDASRRISHPDLERTRLLESRLGTDPGLPRVAEKADDGHRTIIRLRQDVEAPFGDTIDDEDPADHPSFLRWCDAAVAGGQGEPDQGALRWNRGLVRRYGEREGLADGQPQDDLFLTRLGGDGTCLFP